MLESDRARLSQIEAQILKFERSLSALRAEKQLVQERLDSYKYPVTSLPSEMISEIFMQCLPPYPMCPSLLDNYPPISLTLVCRQWRAIALETPELWRAIALDDESHLWRELSKDASRVWIRRSGSLPLSIKLDTKCADRTPLCELYPAIFDHFPRWEHLTLAIAPTNFPTIDGPMALLRYLEFTPNDWYGRFELRNVPQLRVVLLDFTGGRGLTVVLPWQQLTSLTRNEVMTN
ncbi:F-box domain-containing protein [Mycena sanguinolenta]|uniref:F-box domain-containing protein n=1 Tax=Mycena sanguinolenta TaxID=230812 RepID=A0A8H6ZDX4_9AGAR|nr:F-box domain-containing protein [Mycena sanguinolenta]